MRTNTAEGGCRGVVACSGCGTIQRLPVLEPASEARCRRCGTVLQHSVAAQRRRWPCLRHGGARTADRRQPHAFAALPPARRHHREPRDRRLPRLLARRPAADGGLRRRLRRGDTLRPRGDAGRRARQPPPWLARTVAGAGAALGRRAAAVVDGPGLRRCRARHLRPGRGAAQHRDPAGGVGIRGRCVPSAGRGGGVRHGKGLAGHHARPYGTAPGTRVRLRVLRARRAGGGGRRPMPALSPPVAPAQAASDAPRGGADACRLRTLSRGAVLADDTDDAAGRPRRAEHHRRRDSSSSAEASGILASLFSSRASRYR